MELPKNVSALLRERITTFEQLEVLLLLRRRREDTWTRESVSEALGIVSELAGDALEYLRRGDLVESVASTWSFRYRPGTTTLEEAVAGLERAYETSRVEVMKVLSVNAVERVRNSALKRFAGAFVGGGRKGEGE